MGRERRERKRGMEMKRFLDKRESGGNLALFSHFSLYASWLIS